MKCIDEKLIDRRLLLEQITMLETMLQRRSFTSEERFCLKTIQSLLGYIRDQLNDHSN